MAVTRKQRKMMNDAPILQALCKGKFDKLDKQKEARKRCQERKVTAARAIVDELFPVIIWVRLNDAPHLPPIYVRSDLTHVPYLG